MPNFHMDIFLEELNERRNELEGDIFEMLYTLSGALTPYKLISSLFFKPKLNLRCG